MTKGTNRLLLANVDISGDSLKFRTDVIPKSTLYQGSLSDKKKHKKQTETKRKKVTMHKENQVGLNVI